MRLEGHTGPRALFMGLYKYRAQNEHGIVYSKVFPEAQNHFLVRLNDYQWFIREGKQGCHPVLTSKGKSEIVAELKWNYRQPEGPVIYDPEIKSREV